MEAVMSAIEEVKKIIKKIPAGELFSAKTFRQVASADNIKQILSRLVKEGLIERSARGVYTKPKVIKHIGKVPPSARDIAKTLADSTGETIVMHGAEAARQFQLSTQVPMRLIFYTNGDSRTLKIGNSSVELKHVNPSRLVAAGTLAGLAISALIYCGKDNVSNATIDKIKKELSKQDFKKVLNEIENMPVWLANAFYHYNKEK